jgi:putative transposase
LVIGQHRSTQRRKPVDRLDEARMVEDMIALTKDYGRYGYRRIHAMLVRAGWDVSRSVVERLWRREGLKVPQNQPKRRRLWLNDGSCIRLRAERKNHVWTYDFVSEQTHDGRKVRMLNVVDECTREALAMVPQRSFKSHDVIHVLADLMMTHGLPDHIRSDNGPEFVAKAVQKWLHDLGVKTLFITPGSPWENGYIESFNARVRDEFLNGEIFYTMKEIEILTEVWRNQYNKIRPHSSLGYVPPAPEAIGPVFPFTNAMLPSARPLASNGAFN